MAGTIKATCSNCGDVIINYKNFAVLGNSAYPPNSSAYIFLCPCCTEYTYKPCSERIRTLLYKQGVKQITPDYITHKRIFAPQDELTKTLDELKNSGAKIVSVTKQKGWLVLEGTSNPKPTDLKKGYEIIFSD